MGMQPHDGSRGQPALPVLVGEAQIREQVARLASAIARDHPEGEALCVVAVMKGAMMFLADLVRHLPMPLEVELVNVRSYRGTHRQDKVAILDDLGSLAVTGRHVLLVDCVLDSGLTLAALRREIGARRPASLKACVLLSKTRRRTVDREADYVGLEIPDVFVVGYGLDHENRWRHLPYVAQVPRDGTSQENAT